ncbi:MAG: hypothetical protein AAGF67_04100 [Verrucomicrobiota bacterium]
MNTLKKITLLTAALGLTASFSHAQSTERESYDEIDVIYDLIINADIEDLTLDNLNRALIEVAENPGLNPRDGLIDRDRPFGFDINRRNGLTIDTGLIDRSSKTVYGRNSTMLHDGHYVFVYEDDYSDFFVYIHVITSEDVEDLDQSSVELMDTVSVLVSAEDEEGSVNIWIYEETLNNSEDPYKLLQSKADETAMKYGLLHPEEVGEDEDERRFWGGSDDEKAGNGPLNKDRPLNWGSLFDTIRIDPEIIVGSGDDLEKGPTPKNQGFGTIRMAEEERFGESKLYHYNGGVRGELEHIMSGGGSVDPTWGDDDNEGGAGGSWQPNGNPLGR